MRSLLGIFLTTGMIAAAAWGGPAPTTTAKKKTSPSGKTAVHKTSASSHTSTSSVHRTGAKTSAVHRKGAPVQRVTWRNRQLAPSPDRYREIQQALAARGYMQADQVTGVWDQNSMGALARFQTDQNLDPTGKLNSLSLIALGLGPKHDALPTQAVAPEEPGR